MKAWRNKRYCPDDSACRLLKQAKRLSINQENGLSDLAAQVMH